MKTATGIFSIAILFFLSSCNGKTSALLNNVSANKKVTTTITGSRSNSLDPWKVVIDVKAYDFKPGQLVLEIYANDLNDKNVKFDWKDDGNCLITIVQSDSKVRTFQLIADSQQLQLAEI